jgi:hypothetical protein
LGTSTNKRRYRGVDRADQVKMTIEAEVLEDLVIRRSRTTMTRVEIMEEA